MAETKYRQLRTSKASDVPGTILRTVSYIGKNYKTGFAFTVFFLLLSSLAGVISSYLFTSNNYNLYKKACHVCL